MLGALVLALFVAFAHGKGQSGYGSPAKDIPSDTYGGGKKLKPIAPVMPPRDPTFPKDNNYGGSNKGPAPVIPKKIDSNPLGGSFADVDNTLPIGGSCKTTDRWMGVVDCYDCELNTCAKQCIPELPKNFELCYNKTALFNLKTLFLDCLGSDMTKCHRLTDDMALAFLLAHYDQAVMELNRRNECIFRCGRPRVMNCMNMCDPLSPSIDVQKEPIVLCYKSLEGKIHDMLIDFSQCLSQYQALTK